MAPLPKRRHSKARGGKRDVENQRAATLPSLVICKECGKRKVPHQLCGFCGK